MSLRFTLELDGSHSAILTDPAAEDIFCDERGRVQGRFHRGHYQPMGVVRTYHPYINSSWNLSETKTQITITVEDL